MTIMRKSPVRLPGKAARTETRQEWTVVLEYEGEETGPWLIDLSHCPKWDFQDDALWDLKPFGLSVPESPGVSGVQNGILVNRMNRAQASIWFLPKTTPPNAGGPSCTETTDGQVLLALTGSRVFSIAEKLTSLDFTNPRLSAPFFLQGPFSHVPCQIVVLDRQGLDGTILVACSRGYGHDMVRAVMDAGREFALRPAGEDAFARLIRDLPSGGMKAEASAPSGQPVRGKGKPRPGKK